MKKLIVQLCADTGSDTWPYRNDDNYEVITIGKDVGVENFHPTRPIHGIIANPVCTQFSRVTNFNDAERDLEQGMFLVRECQRVIAEANEIQQLAWWAIENPATGLLKRFLGTPHLAYEPWWYGSPWTKKTALWGEFNIPERKYYDWSEVRQNPMLWVRHGRKTSLVWLHKSAWHDIAEFRDSGMPAPTNDMEFRSLCSQKFAQAFKDANP